MTNMMTCMTKQTSEYGSEGFSVHEYYTGKPSGSRWRARKGTKLGGGTCITSRKLREIDRKANRAKFMVEMGKEANLEKASNIAKAGETKKRRKKARSRDRDVQAHDPMAGENDTWGWTGGHIPPWQEQQVPGKIEVISKDNCWIPEICDIKDVIATDIVPGNVRVINLYNF